MNYSTIYAALIERARDRVRRYGRHYERHHVKPRCLRGGNEVSNLVWLTPEEHYVAHQLLVKLYPGNGKLLWAALAMTGAGRGNGRAGNKLYGWLRRKFVIQQTGSVRWDAKTKAKIGAASKARNQGEKHPMFGRKHSEATKALLRASRIGKPSPMKDREFSQEHRRKLSDARKRAVARGVLPFKGQKHSEETRAKMRAAKAKLREAA